MVEGHSSIGLLTFDVKIQLIDQIHSMVYVDFKVMGVYGGGAFIPGLVSYIYGYRKPSFDG